MANIGLMEGAFFVGRLEILDFINRTLELRLSKVEETASGCVACQMLDIMYPGSVPMQKVDWAAKKDFEWVHNYKILQTAFTKLKIDRHIDVDRLIQGKYMDNLEFMQWFKRFYELQVSDKGDYDCKARRALGKGGAAVPWSGKLGSPGVLKPAAAKAAAATAAATGAPGATAKAKPASAPAAPAPAAAAAAKPKPASAPSMASKKAAPATQPPSSSAASSHEVAELANQVAKLKRANEDAVRGGNELRAEMDALEKERDYYFQKLRDIEILMQDLEDNGKGNDLTASVFKILYATQEGFESENQAPNDAPAASPVAPSVAASSPMKVVASAAPEDDIDAPFMLVGDIDAEGL